MPCTATGEVAPGIAQRETHETFCTRSRFR